MDADDVKLSETALKIYIYLLSKGRPIGPRQVTRDMKLSSPSIAYYHLEQLRRQGLLKKTQDGYIISQRINIDGYVYIGKRVVPRLIIYSMFLLGLFISEIIVLYLRIQGGINIDIDFIVLIMVSGLTAILMLAEGILMYFRIYK